MLVFPQLAGVSGNAGLYSQCMFAEAFGFRKLADDFPSLITSEHEVHCRAGGAQENASPRVTLLPVQRRSFLASALAVPAMRYAFAASSLDLAAIERPRV